MDAADERSGLCFSHSSWQFIHCHNADGHAKAFRATDKFEKIAENNLGDGGGNATPVVSDNKILIRTDHSLFVWGQIRESR